MSIAPIYQGIQWEERLTVTVKATGALQPLGGIPLRLEIKTISGGVLLLALTEGAGITTLAQSGGTLGQADVTITPAQASGLPAGVHELHVKGTVGGVDKLIIQPDHVIVRAL